MVFPPSQALALESSEPGEWTAGHGSHTDGVQVFTNFNGKFNRSSPFTQPSREQAQRAQEPVEPVQPAMIRAGVAQPSSKRAGDRF